MAANISRVFYALNRFPNAILFLAIATKYLNFVEVSDNLLRG
jgi:hypothetical protein